MFVEHRRASSCSPITSPSYGDLRLPATSSSPTTVAYLCATLHIVLSNGRLLIFMRLSSSSSPTGGAHLYAILHIVLSDDGCLSL